MTKEVSAFEAWQAASEAGMILDPLPTIPGSCVREVHAGNGVALPAWKIITDDNGKTIAYEPAH